MGVAATFSQVGQQTGGKMKSPDYIAVLAILNAMSRRVSESLPQIEKSTRELGNWGIPGKDAGK
jgi:hypothetical protein